MNANTRPSGELYRRLMTYVVPHWRILALCVVTLALYAATDPILPALLQPFLDGSFLEARSTRALLFPALIVLLFVVRGALNYTSTVAINWLSQRVMTDLRDAMFRRLVMLPIPFYAGASAGELISRLTYDVSQVQQAASKVLLVIVKDSLSIVALVGYMTWVNWRLALVVFALAPAVFHAVRRISARLREMSRRVQQSMGAITHVAEEAIEGCKVVKIFAGQDYEVRRFEQASNNARKYSMKFIMAGSANEPLILLIVATGIAVMIYAAIWLSSSRLMTVGEFVSFFTAMTLLIAPTRRLTGINEALQRGLAAAESIFGLIDERQEQDVGTVDCGRVRGDMAFERVCFTYPGAHDAALREVSFAIAAGETVALVGASGSGKTTLAALVPRFYHPDSGRILIDGRDIADTTLKSLRANIALVSQEVVLFNDTIGNNIAYGALRGATAADVIRAATAAHAMEFIAAMPAGLDTVIGENGVRLSGGQRQRLAIARALLKDAPVLILYEATSALDAVSERHIQEALETLRRGRTCLIIAHRLSTIENADRIVVLSEGRVIETGTHRDLLARNGAYAALYRVQYADQENSLAGT